MTKVLTHLDLNVWHNGITWCFTVYDVINGSLDSDSYASLDTTEDRIKRYLEVVPTQDEDWWVGNEDASFYYILWGERKES